MIFLQSFRETEFRVRELELQEGGRSTLITKEAVDRGDLERWCKNSHW